MEGAEQGRWISKCAIEFRVLSGATLVGESQMILRLCTTDGVDVLSFYFGNVSTASCIPLDYCYCASCSGLTLHVAIAYFIIDGNLQHLQVFALAIDFVQ